MKKISAFPVYAIYFFEIVNEKWCSDKSIGQTENGLERGFVKHGLNLVKKKNWAKLSSLKYKDIKHFLQKEKKKHHRFGVITDWSSVDVCPAIFFKLLVIIYMLIIPLETPTFNVGREAKKLVNGVFLLGS